MAEQHLTVKQWKMKCRLHICLWLWCVCVQCIKNRNAFQNACFKKIVKMLKCQRANNQDKFVLPLHWGRPPALKCQTHRPWWWSVYHLRGMATGASGDRLQITRLSKFFMKSSKSILKTEKMQHHMYIFPHSNCFTNQKQLLQYEFNELFTPIVLSKRIAWPLHIYM